MSSFGDKLFFPLKLLVWRPYWLIFTLLAYIVCELRIKIVVYQKNAWNFLDGKGLIGGLWNKQTPSGLLVYRRVMPSAGRLSPRFHSCPRSLASLSGATWHRSVIQIYTIWQQHRQMEVECPRHPGASNIGSQLLDETAPIASKSWQPSHEPPRRREEGHLSH